MEVALDYEGLNLIVEELTAAKLDLLIINALSFLIAISLIYFFSRAKKSGELREINNNFDKVLRQQSVLTTETENIKKSLEKDLVDYQIKLSAYHQKSIDAVCEIYEAILSLREAAKNLGFSKTDEDARAFIRAIEHFRRIFDYQKIWISNDLECHIENVAIEMERKCQSFVAANTREKYIPSLSEVRINQLIDDQEAFYDYLHKEVNTIFNELAEKISASVAR
jgi:uncharacterized protein YoxC